ncbi:hypothetical protein S83_008530, partial [Arachis hypogaea]
LLWTGSHSGWIFLTQRIRDSYIVYTSDDIKPEGKKSKHGWLKKKYHLVESDDDGDGDGDSIIQTALETNN